MKIFYAMTNVAPAASSRAGIVFRLVAGTFIATVQFQVITGLYEPMDVTGQLLHALGAAACFVLLRFVVGSWWRCVAIALFVPLFQRSSHYITNGGPLFVIGFFIIGLLVVPRLLGFNRLTLHTIVLAAILQAVTYLPHPNKLMVALDHVVPASLGAAALAWLWRRRVPWGVMSNFKRKLREQSMVVTLNATNGYGDKLPPASIQMRGMQLVGGGEIDDIVEVCGKWTLGEIARASDLRVAGSDEIISAVEGIVTLRGEVRDLAKEWQGEPEASQAQWSFKVAWHADKRLLVPVTLTGWELEGALEDGDEIAMGISAPWKKGDPPIPTTGLNNLTRRELLSVIAVRRLRGTVSSYRERPEKTLTQSRTYQQSKSTNYGGFTTTTEGVTSAPGKSVTHFLWSFRLTQHDEVGNVIGKQHNVEMRGTRISGNIADGDEVVVEVSDDWEPGEIIKTSGIVVETTGVNVTVDTE